MLWFGFRLSEPELTEGRQAPGDGQRFELVVELPPQHIAELAFDELTFLQDVPKTFSAASLARISGPSRIVYGLRDTRDLEELDLNELLSWIRGGLVRPGPLDAQTPATSGETVIEFPTGLELTPTSPTAWIDDNAEAPSSPWHELWTLRPGSAPKRPGEPSFAAEPVSFRARHAYTVELPPPATSKTTLSPDDRKGIVARTRDSGTIEAIVNPLIPIRPKRFALGLFGAIADIDASWPPWKSPPPSPTNLVGWRHRAWLGRDTFVRIAHQGVLYPWGHEAHWVDVFERKVTAIGGGAPFALVLSHSYVELKHDSLKYPFHQDTVTDARKNPFTKITFKTLRTPALDLGLEILPRSGQGVTASKIRVAGETFRFACEAQDQAAAPHALELGAFWVSANNGRLPNSAQLLKEALAGDREVGKVALWRRKLGLVPTKDETALLVAESATFEASAHQDSFFPILLELQAEVPGAQELFSRSAAVSEGSLESVVQTLNEFEEALNRLTASRETKDALDTVTVDQHLEAAKLEPLRNALDEIHAAAGRARFAFARSRIFDAKSPAAESERKALADALESATAAARAVLGKNTIGVDKLEQDALDKRNKLPGLSNAELDDIKLQHRILAPPELELIRRELDAACELRSPLAALDSIATTRGRLASLAELTPRPLTLELAAAQRLLELEKAAVQVSGQITEDFNGLRAEAEASLDKAGHEIADRIALAERTITAALGASPTLVKIGNLGNGKPHPLSPIVEQGIANALASIAAEANRCKAQLGKLAKAATHAAIAVPAAVNDFNDVAKQVRSWLEEIERALGAGTAEALQARRMLEAAGNALSLAPLVTKWTDGATAMQIEIETQFLERQARLDRAIDSSIEVIRELANRPSAPDVTTLLESGAKHLAAARDLAPKWTTLAAGGNTLGSLFMALQGPQDKGFPANELLGLPLRRAWQQLARAEYALGGVQLPKELQAFQTEVNRYCGQARKALVVLQEQASTALVAVEGSLAGVLTYDLKSAAAVCDAQLGVLAQAVEAGLGRVANDLQSIRALPTDQARLLMVALGDRAALADACAAQARHAARELAGGVESVAAPMKNALSTLEYAQRYLDHGLSSNNPVQVFAKLKDTLRSDFDPRELHGLATPNFSIEALSIGHGPIGDLAKMELGKFDPKSFFPDAKLFGSIRLADILQVATGDLHFDKAPKLQRIVNGPNDLAVKYELHSVEPPNCAFFKEDKTNGPFQLHITVETRVRPELKPPTTTIRIENFALLVDGMMSIAFRKANFENGKLSVEIGKVTFLGALQFFEELQKLLPFGDQTKGPFVHLSPTSLETGISVAIPEIGVGVFALQGVSAMAKLELPFTGGHGRIHFGFSTPEYPFRLTAAFLAGGGSIGVICRTSGGRALESVRASLEFGASAMVSFGIAAASASMMAGIYLEYSAEGAVLTGYFRLSAHVEILGFISVSIVFMLALKYSTETRCLEGSAKLIINVKVLCFSKAVTLEVRRTFAGSGATALSSHERDERLAAGELPDADGAFALFGMPELLNPRTGRPTRRKEVLGKPEWKIYQSAFDFNFMEPDPQ